MEDTTTTSLIAIGAVIFIFVVFSKININDIHCIERLEIIYNCLNTRYLQRRRISSSDMTPLPLYVREEVTSNNPEESISNDSIETGSINLSVDTSEDIEAGSIEGNLSYELDYTEEPTEEKEP
jgi:hypothetical protein